MKYISANNINKILISWQQYQEWQQKFSTYSKREETLVQVENMGTLFLVAINGILGELWYGMNESLFVDNLVVYIITRN